MQSLIVKESIQVMDRSNQFVESQPFLVRLDLGVLPQCHQLKPQKSGIACKADIQHLF